MLFLWEVASQQDWIPVFYISSPTKVITQVLSWFTSGFIWKHLWITFSETFIGFLIGLILGVIVAIIFSQWTFVATLFEPFLVLLNALPRLVLAPLFVLWFGLGLLSKVFMVVSLVFFIIFFNTYRGIKEVDPLLIHNAIILGASKKQILWHVITPSALTWVFSSFRTAVGFAVIGAVIGEYLGSSAGVGYLILEAEAFFNATGVIAGLTVLIIFVGIIDWGVVVLERRFSRWKVPLTSS